MTVGTGLMMPLSKFHVRLPRLFPLTDKRTLPAIPIASKYRLIDVPLSNLINSGINKVYVLTQYNSTSLNRYLQHTYGRTAGDGQSFVEVVAATQGPKDQRWAEGPADTVRQWWKLFEGHANSRFVEDVLVLPSDQVYRMDFMQLVDFHRNSLADLTIVCTPVAEQLVDHFGIVKLGQGTAIQSFVEKPKGAMKADMSMDMIELEEFMQESHLDHVPYVDATGSKTWIGSCGMYLFRKEALKELLSRNKKARDFGRELIPDAVRSGMKVTAFCLPDYWVDIGGSIQEFYDFHMSLVSGKAGFDFGQGSTFYCSPSELPPNTYNNARIHNSIIGNGCRLNECTVTDTVIGSRTQIGKGTVLTSSIIMGADYYEEEKEWPRKVSRNYPHIGIGDNCIIAKAIIDKNARIGNNVQLVNQEGVEESMDRISKGIAIRDGIIIISKSAVIPDGTIV